MTKSTKVNFTVIRGLVFSLIALFIGAGSNAAEANLEGTGIETPLSVVVDPGTGLANASYSLAASGGVNVTNWQVMGLTDGPDLDFGYYDFLQFELTLPVGCTNALIFNFGTTNTVGIPAGPSPNMPVWELPLGTMNYGSWVNQGLDDTNCVFMVPASQLVADGTMHTYRLDLGLIQCWRDRLHGLRIHLADNGVFTLGSVLVGDPGPEIPFDPVIPGGYAGSNSCLYLSSKHATVWWDTTDAGYAANAAVLARHTLRMTEESWNVYVRLHGHIDPCAAKKLSITTFYGGTWNGGANWFNIPSWAAGDEGGGNPVPHEFGHSVDAASPTFIYGPQWESHANFHRVQRNLYFWKTLRVDYPDSRAVAFATAYLPFTSFMPDYGTLIYHDFRYLLPLNDYGPSYGLEGNGDAALWTQGTGLNLKISEKLAQLLPNGANKTVACQAMMRWPELDFVEKDRIADLDAWDTEGKKALWMWQMRSALVPQPDKPGWWRVPSSRAPEAWGFMVHELAATPGNTVSVTLRGYDLPYADGNSDWRWGFAAVASNGVVRYSPVTGPGTQGFTLNNDETKLLLVVTATPNDPSVDLDSHDRNKAIDKHSDRLRYAYEVNLVNASPASLACNWPVAGNLAPAPNGGGMVESTAYVAPTAYVGPNAKVLGNAQVLGNARILDYATVAENAVVKDDAIVSGSALVIGSAVVSDEARVRDHALVQSVPWIGTGEISGRATVSEYANVSRPVQDDAIVRGAATPGGGNYSGTVILDYNYGMGSSLSDGVHFSSVAWDFGGYLSGWQSAQAKPRGAVASYRTVEPNGELWLDEFGAQQAFLRGTPARPFDATLRSPVLSLDGTSQYAVLDRNVVDSRRFSFSIWVNPADEIGMAQPIFFDGASATKALSLVRDAAGHASLSIGDGTTTQTLVSTSVLPANQWTHVAFTLDHGSSGTLYVNGMPEATGAIGLTPVDVLSANDSLSVQAIYIGRDWSGNLFHGLVDDARFYNVTRSDGEVREEMFRRGDKLAAYSPATATCFDGVADTAQSGVRNGKVRTLAAWVKPANISQSYGAIFDSYDESKSTAGSGLAVANGQWVASLDNVGTWNTGVAATGNVWQHVALAFDGTTATFFLNGVQRATRTYSGPADDVAATAKCYRIGYSQTSTTTNHFNGCILAACVFDRALTAPELILSTAQQVYANASTHTDAVQVELGNDPLQPAGTIYTDDNDGDGMPDIWELANGLNPQDPADAVLDADGDGYSNLAESRAGTNPLDPGSIPWGTTISVNYEVSSSSTPPEDPAATAGVAPFSNWNNITNTGAGGLANPAQTFSDSTGAAVPGFNAMASSTAASSWNSGGDANATLFGDFALAAGGTLALTNVPYANYNLIVYFSGWGAPNVINYTVGSQTQTMTNTVGVVSTFTQGNNYVILTNLTAGSVVLNVGKVSGETVGIAAFQVAGRPEVNTNTAPTLTGIADQAVPYNTSSAALPFIVGDAQTAAESLVVTAGSSDTNLFPNGSIVLGGSGTNRTVTLTPAANKAGTAIITLTVDDGDMATSRGFVATVSNNPPTIGSIANQAVAMNGATAALPFTVGDVEMAADSLTVSGSSDNPDLVPNGNIVLGGSGADRTVTVTPAAGYIGQARITLSVSDGSAVTSTSFQLVVTSSGTAISVNYCQANDVLPVAAVAGAVPTNHWNSILQANYASPTNVFYDCTGAFIGGFGATLSTGANSTWNSGNPSQPDQALCADWAVNGGGTVTFANIPYASYDLYVYFNGYGGAANVVNYTIDGITQTLTDSTIAPWQFNGTYVQGTDYVKFSGLTNANPVMTVSGVSGGTYGLAAFQIVNHPAQVPAAPTGLSATAGNGQVALSWNASTNAASYNVKRSTVSGGGYATVTNVAGTSVVDVGLTGGTTYYYVVSALNAGNESDNSAEASATPTSTPPAAPASLVATAGDGSVTLDWADNAEPDLAGYTVYRSTTSGSGYGIIASGLPASDYVDTVVVNGTTYYYVVTATDTASNESSNSTEASAMPQVDAPSSPTGLGATAVSISQIDLSWTASTGADSYNVKRAATSGGPYAVVATAVSGTSYSDGGLSASTTYYYVVSAVNAGGESANSAEAGATTQTSAPTPPAAPTGLNAMAASINHIDLDWTASSGATGYNVKWAAVSGGPYTTVVADWGTVSYSDIGVFAGSTNYYVVSAVNADGESANSTEAVAATPELVAYLTFDETSGTTAADASPNGFDGTLVNGPVWATGILTNSVLLDGADDYVSLPSGAVADAGDFTIATWVYLDSVSTWSRVFDFGSGTATNMFLAPQSGSGAVRYAIRAGGAEQQINGPSPLLASVWTHVAVTWSGGTGILYVDGVAAGTNSAMTLYPAALGNTTQNYIGKSQYADPYLDGAVDDFRIIGRALSASEIATLATPPADTTAPAAPTGLGATAGDSSVALDWADNAEPDLASYSVYRSTTSGNGYAVIATGLAASDYVDSTVVNGTTYYYVVTALDVWANESADSSEASATPAGVPTWTELVYDDFESGIGNYTDGGGDCVWAASGYSPQGSYSMDIQDNSGTASSFWLTSGLDVASPGYTQIQVDFSFQAVSMDNSSEDFWLQYYDGSTWQTVATYARTTDFVNNVIYDISVVIDEASHTFPSNMQIRFMCDASGNIDDVYIDEVRISAK